MRTQHNKGFTLVELLVVIGIIALLISILLPSLNKARQAAQTVACQSNLRQIANAMTAYLGEHKGSFPYYHLDDSGAARTSHTWYGRLNPYTRYRFDKNADAYITSCQPGLANTIFRCPTDSVGLMTTSYGLNNLYLNRMFPWSWTLASANKPDTRHTTAKITQIKSPSETVMVTDNGWNSVGIPQVWATVGGHYNLVVPPSWLSSWGGYDRPAFIHSGRCNVLWVDGHVTAEMQGSEFFPKKYPWSGNGINALFGGTPAAPNWLNPDLSVLGNPDYVDRMWDLW